MDRKTLALDETTTSDEGTFAALASAYSTDRQGERIEPGAFKATIARWQATGRNIPLAWNHETSADAIIGSVDPATMVETPLGLRVEGKLDLKDSQTAREAWRSMRNNAVGLSFGYMVLADHTDAKGVRVLTELDVFEITITPSPANPDTAILSTKSLDPEYDAMRDKAFRQMYGLLVPPDEQLRAEAKRVADAEAKAARAKPIRVAEFPC